MHRRLLGKKKIISYVRQPDYRKVLEYYTARMSWYALATAAAYIHTYHTYLQDILYVQYA